MTHSAGGGSRADGGIQVAQKSQNYAQILGSLLVAALLFGTYLVGYSGTASATVPKPKISKFVASPKSVTTTDGDVTLSATVANATSCTLSSHQLVAGLPITTSCTSGSVSHAVVLALDTGVRADKYKFTLAATGSGGNKSKSVTVSVLPGAGQPFPSGFTATYVGSNDDRSQIDANLSLAGSVGPDCSRTHGRISREHGTIPLKQIARRRRPTKRTTASAEVVLSKPIRQARPGIRPTSTSRFGQHRSVIRPKSSSFRT